MKLKWAFTFLWAVTISFGFVELFSLAFTEGSVGKITRTPANTKLLRLEGRPQLLLFVHPKCSCSKATIVELRKLLLNKEELSVKVIFTDHPADYSWINGELWEEAKSIPGVEVLVDSGNAEAKLFDVQTSGHALLFDEEGVQVFSGGLTPSRGHEGMNAGSYFIENWLKKRSQATFVSKIFGCGLFKDFNS